MRGGKLSADHPDHGGRSAGWAHLPGAGHHPQAARCRPLARCLAGQSRRHGSPPGAATRLRDGVGQVSALRGKGILRELLSLNLLRGFWPGLKAIRQVRPMSCLAWAATSLPGGMMAALTGVPLVLTNKNSVAGLANEYGRRRRPYRDRLPKVLNKGEWVGNPVRPEIAARPAGRAFRRAQRPAACAGHRRQPGGAGAQRDHSAGRGPAA